MILFPNCKINLGLHILEKRTDGFHELETVFYPLPLLDALEVVQSVDDTSKFTTSGLTIEGGSENNICLKACGLLKKDFPTLPAVNMHLHKVIPTGAGLGGGSADGAFTLLLLNKKFGLGIEEEKLVDYALQLGSDCPFFIRNKACYARGRGEKMEEIHLDLSSYKIALVHPRIHINTGWAFSKIAPSKQRTSIKEIVQKPIKTWRNELVNDFEEIVFEEHPEIKKIKESLYEKGASYSSMSGSGSTVFGIFEKNKDLLFDFPSNYFVKW
jgi:4-diphosphocytidyl-2-C-methyl-D-erythritol kinase